MISRTNKRTAKIAYFAVIHGIYFEQFPGLKENLYRYHDELLQKVKANDVEVVDFGFVDSSERSFEVAKEIQKMNPDVVFCNMITYATSSVFAPIMKEVNAPMVLLALQPRQALDYSKANTFTPTEVFNSPRNLFVASFIGTPQMNFIDGKLVIKDDKYYISVFGKEISLSETLSNKLKEKGIEEKEVTMGIRPDHFKLGVTGEDSFTGSILVSEMMGTEYHLHLNIEENKLAIKVPLMGMDGNMLHQIALGGDITFGFESDCIYIFDKETTLNLGE